jgi:hypothetical protein
MKTTFRFGSPCRLAGLLLLLYCLSASDGCAADSVGVPPEGSAAEAIVSEAFPTKRSRDDRDLHANHSPHVCTIASGFFKPPRHSAQAGMARS